MLYPFSPFAICLVSWSTVREARKLGSLGGLDTRPYPLFFVTNMCWTCYGISIGDVWLWLSGAPAAVVWLYFCMNSVSLMSQEEGELEYSPTYEAGGLLFHPRSLDLPVDLGQLSQFYRKRQVQRTQEGVVAGLSFTMLVSFGCSPWNIPGLQFLDDVITVDMKSAAFSAVCGVLSALCSVLPVTRLWTLIKKRDASSIFFPLVVAQMLTLTNWIIYGLLVGDAGMYIPSALGVGVCLARLVIKCAFARNSPEGGDDDALEEVDMDSVMPRTPPSQIGKSSPMSVLEADDVQSSTLGNPTLFGGMAVPSASLNLPDFIPIFKEEGVYEDYLKWQAGYTKRRRGGILGASGAELCYRPFRMQSQVADFLLTQGFEDLQEILTAVSAESRHKQIRYTLVTASITKPLWKIFQEDKRWRHLRVLESRALHKPQANCSHSFILTKGRDKMMMVYQLLEPELTGRVNAKQTLVFCNTITSCKSVGHQLQQHFQSSGTD
ncbi:unnamed protein product, partial [Polarella glacialis]